MKMPPPSPRCTGCMGEKCANTKIGPSGGYVHPYAIFRRKIMHDVDCLGFCSVLGRLLFPSHIIAPLVFVLLPYVQYLLFLLINDPFPGKRERDTGGIKEIKERHPPAP